MANMLTRRGNFSVPFIFISWCAVSLISSPYLVDGFSGPLHRGFSSSLSAPSIPILGSFTVDGPHSLRMGHLSMVKNNLNDKNHDSESIAFSRISSWAKNNKKMLYTTATVAATTAAFTVGMPSISHAAGTIDELVSITGGSSGVLSILSASTEMYDKISSTGFYQAFSLVFLSELGDKTFFIAGLLAMKTSRIVSFIGSIGALTAMTAISCVLGQIFHAIPSGIAQGVPFDDIAAVLAFSFFGFKILKEAFELDPEGKSVMDEELADAEEAVEGSETIQQVTAWAQIISTFALVFAAEFGDRSFLSTIALSAAQNPFSVGAGAVAAHAVATGIAVLGGGVIAKYLSEKVIGYIGGSLFLVFAFTTAIGIF